MLALDNGEFLVAGSTASYGSGMNDCWILKTSGEGDVVMNLTIGGAMNDLGKSVKETLGGYFIAGTSESFGDNLVDGYIIKVDTVGNLVWENTYGGSSDDYLESIEAQPDGNIIAVGFTSSTGTGESDVWG